MIDLAEIKDLTKGLSEEIILSKFKEQLVKDFSMCRIELIFPQTNELSANYFPDTIKNGIRNLDSHPLWNYFIALIFLRQD